MEQTHAGRTAVITGAAQGIGRAYARELAQRGARIVVADLAPADETLAMIAAAGAEGVAVRADLSEPESAETVLAAADGLGGADILVLNAAIQPFVAFERMTFDDWRRVMAVNVDPLFHLCKALLPGMRARGWGRIVAMSSNTYQLGVPGVAHYVASKGAVQGFVRSLSGEIGRDGVTINAIAPGLTRTPGTSTGPQDELGLFQRAIEGQAIKRTQQPEDLVGALAFLTSDDSAFVTGQTVLVDGGWAHV